jgi:hypothetical protein
MIKIDTKTLEDLKPCQNRLDNWFEHYKGFDGTCSEFLDLDKISDKIWVVRKTLPREVLQEWSVLCAESVLHLFEEKYPEDKRPRECLEYLKTKEVEPEELGMHKAAAEAAANHAANHAEVAAEAAAYAILRAAEAAAANHAAYAANHAAYAAYAILRAAEAAANHAAYAAYAATYYVAAAADALTKQRNKNLEFLKSLLKEV